MWNGATARANLCGRDARAVTYATSGGKCAVGKDRSAVGPNILQRCTVAAHAVAKRIDTSSPKGDRHAVLVVESVVIGLSQVCQCNLIACCGANGRKSVLPAAANAWVCIV